MADSTQAAPAESADIAAPADPALCPRCGGKLSNPDGLGWCPGCGYCRSLEEEGQTVAAVPAPSAPKQPSLLGAAEFGLVLQLAPAWLWPLLGGMAVVAAISVAVDYQLAETCLVRAVWSAVQMLLSLVGLVFAQLWTVLLIAADEEKLGARDVLPSIRLWKAGLRRLPMTRKPVWLGAWCLTGLLCGLLVVGGFNYWLELVKANKAKPTAVASEKQ
jgi:hypothetical protein